MTAETAHLPNADCIGPIDTIGAGPTLTRVTLRSKKWFDNGTYRSRRFACYIRHNASEDAIDIARQYAEEHYGAKKLEVDKRP